MTQEEFEAAAAAAIAPYHDPKQDGPLLTCIRPTASFVGDGIWEVWPEYSCVLMEWPERKNGSGYGWPANDADYAISCLVEEARKLWVARQPEPTEEDEPEGAQYAEFGARTMGF